MYHVCEEIKLKSIQEHFEHVALLRSPSLSRNPLKFTVEQVTRVDLYPEAEEQENILNVKRGIVSALLVPVEEEQHNSHMVSASFFNVRSVFINKLDKTTIQLNVPLDGFHTSSMSKGMGCK